MENTIRLLGENDSEAYKKLRLACLKSDPLSWLSTLDSEQNYPTNYFAIKLRTSVAAPSFGTYGLFENGSLVSYACLASNYWVKKNHIVNLYDVCTDPTKRRHGYSSKLIKFIIETAKKIPEAEKLTLRVNSRNTGAIAFYEKLGFIKEVALRDEIKEKDGTYQDEYVYSLNF